MLTDLYIINHTAYIIINGEVIKCFPPKLRTRQEYLLPRLASSVVLGGVARAIRHEGEIKGIRIDKEKIKLSLWVA